MAGSASENMLRLWSEIVEYYMHHRISCRYSGLGLFQFTDPAKPKSDYPRLKGRGMEIKHIFEPLRACFKKYSNPGNDDDFKTNNCLDWMSELIKIFDEYADDMFFPKIAGDRILVLADDFLETYAILSNRATERGDLLWHVLPKHHVFWHLCFRCRYSHPRVGNCCLGEDPCWEGQGHRRRFHCWLGSTQDSRQGE